jgi:hypothetical protein
MSPVTKQIVEMIDMLPEQEQQLAFELIKRMVLAWDSDFTKLTPFERERLNKAEKEIQNGETASHSEVDWD